MFSIVLQAALRRSRSCVNHYMHMWQRMTPAPHTLISPYSVTRLLMRLVLSDESTSALRRLFLYTICFLIPDMETGSHFDLVAVNVTLGTGCQALV